MRYGAGQHLGHRTLFVGQDASVRTDHLERAAEPLIGVSDRRCAAPQLGGAAVELPDHARGVTGIHGHRTEFEQGAKALLAVSQGVLGLPQPRGVEEVAHHAVLAIGKRDAVNLPLVGLDHIHIVALARSGSGRCRARRSGACAGRCRSPRWRTARAREYASLRRSRGRCRRLMLRNAGANRR